MSSQACAPRGMPELFDWLLSIGSRMSQSTVRPLSLFRSIHAPTAEVLLVRRWPCLWTQTTGHCPPPPSRDLGPPPPGHGRFVDFNRGGAGPRGTDGMPRRNLDDVLCFKVRHGQTSFRSPTRPDSNDPVPSAIRKATTLTLVGTKHYRGVAVLLMG